MENMVSAEGIESALKQQRKNLVERSWQSKALSVHDRQQSDFRNRVAGELSMPRRANEIVVMLLWFEVAAALRGVVQGMRVNTTTPQATPSGQVIERNRDG